MKVLLFASKSRDYKYLKSIYSELVRRGHDAFFLYTEENITQAPYHGKDMPNKFFYDCSDSNFDFTNGVKFTPFEILPYIPFSPDYLILNRERWEPEQTIIRCFKEEFENGKIGYVEVNAEFYTVIVNRLESLSRIKPPQNQIDILFEQSEFILNARKSTVEWDKWDNSVVVGNPCYDDLMDELKDGDVYDKLSKTYDIDKSKKQILFFSVVNIDRPVTLDLLRNLAEKCGDGYQIFYKPFPGEPTSWPKDFNPNFLVDGVQVIYNHLDLFPMYHLCDIHIGTISSVNYPSLLLNKKVVNTHNFCKHIDAGNDFDVYERNEDWLHGTGDLNLWLRVHDLPDFESFKELVGVERVEKFKKHNESVKKIISEATYDYDMDLKFLEDDTPRDYSKLLKIFDEYNDGKASERIVDVLEKSL